MKDKELVNALREHAEWQRGNEWETPITLGDDLVEAADRIEAQAKEIEKLRGQNEQLREAAALVAKESAELLERRWISVTERRPEYNARVLVIDVYAGEGNEFIAIWTREEYPDDPEDGCWIDERGWWHSCDDVTHWMPLPDRPEAEKALEAMKDE